MKTLLPVKIQPNSSKNEIAGFEGEVLKIRIKAAPEKDKANLELIRFLSKKFNISRSDITIIKGRTSRKKMLQLENISRKDLEQIIKN